MRFGLTLKGLQVLNQLNAWPGLDTRITNYLWQLQSRGAITSLKQLRAPPPNTCLQCGHNEAKHGWKHRDGHTTCKVKECTCAEYKKAQAKLGKRSEARLFDWLIQHDYAAELPRCPTCGQHLEEPKL